MQLIHRPAEAFEICFGLHETNYCCHPCHATCPPSFSGLIQLFLLDCQFGDGGMTLQSALLSLSYLNANECAATSQRAAETVWIFNILSHQKVTALAVRWGMSTCSLIKSSPNNVPLGMCWVTLCAKASSGLCMCWSGLMCADADVPSPHYNEQLLIASPSCGGGSRQRLRLSQPGNNYMPWLVGSLMTNGCRKIHWI